MDKTETTKNQDPNSTQTTQQRDIDTRPPPPLAMPNPAMDPREDDFELVGFGD